MHNGKNLLEIEAMSVHEYIIALMEELFSNSELSKGLIIEDPSLVNHSSRKPLDHDKIKMLKEAVFLRYEIPAEKKEEVWDRIKEIGNRKCRECRDKNKKKKERCWLIKSKYYYLI
jgi:hypothetical protein